jgi:hypothetical protein
MADEDAAAIAARKEERLKRAREMKDKLTAQLAVAANGKEEKTDVKKEDENGSKDVKVAGDDDKKKREDKKDDKKEGKREKDDRRDRRDSGGKGRSRDRGDKRRSRSRSRDRKDRDRRRSRSRSRDRKERDRRRSRSRSRSKGRDKGKRDEKRAKTDGKDSQKSDASSAKKSEVDDIEEQVSTLDLCNRRFKLLGSCFAHFFKCFSSTITCLHADSMHSHVVSRCVCAANVWHNGAHRKQEAQPLRMAQQHLQTAQHSLQRAGVT